MFNSVIWSLQSKNLSEHDVSRAEKDKFHWFTSYDLWS